ncbi:site-2 protease family protein [Actinomyces howellii]|uniref:Zn-dependent proteases n=1 Tax=Actinomyces howellii TaxID=52771 RepID=A0A3S4QZL7_9ACTO|nr:site-2 protease family protein [Actinomyces howellii]VEG26332.1 Zn-dependent proteases [Actinomyces howellii]
MPSATAPEGWVLGRVGGAPVVVAPTSLLLGALIAASWYPLVSSALTGFGILTVLGVVGLTVAGVAVSVTLHELAHGMAGTALGRRPVRYELYLWGGRTSFGPSRSWRPWKDVLTSLSGPATNLVLWALGRWALGSGVVETVPAYVAVWALTWVNLALAAFNALPCLPLDGGHALAALVEQVTGRPRLGRQVAAVGGLAVLALIAWRWLLWPLVVQGTRPGSFQLVLAVMVGWPIAATSWRVLGLGRGGRAASRVDLRELAQAVAVLPAAAPLEQVRARLAEGAALVIVLDGSRVLGTVDDQDLSRLDPPPGAKVTAGQTCTVLPAVAVTSQTGGPGAVSALARAREVSRWLVVIDEGTIVGAVPTGAR